MSKIVSRGAGPLFRAPALALPPAIVLALAGCELDEVAIPGGEDILVVEAILDASKEAQHVLLHRSVAGARVRGEKGARVVVRRGDGLEVTFVEAPLEACANIDQRRTEGADAVKLRASCYLSPLDTGRWVIPGERYELLVETAAGERLQGRTTLPGSFELLGLSPAASPASEGEEFCIIPPGSPITLHWSVAPGAAAYLTHLRIDGIRDALAGSGIPGIPEVVELYGASISELDTTIVIPAEMGVFELGKYPHELMLALSGGFPAGTVVHLTIGAMDRNYVTAVRGDSYNPSGMVRVSTVAGDGIGVFGSVIRHVLAMWVHDGEGDSCLADPSRAR